MTMIKLGADCIIVQTYVANDWGKEANNLQNLLRYYVVRVTFTAAVRSIK